jgi:hypothetical protein
MICNPQSLNFEERAMPFINCQAEQDLEGVWFERASLALSRQKEFYYLKILNKI